MRLHHLARAILTPVLLGQAFFVRRRVRRLPEAAGAREGRVGLGPPLRLLILGDSSGAGVGAATQDEALLGQVVSRLAESHAVEFRLIAVPGARTADAYGWLQDVTETYDVAITALGVNDVTKLTPLHAFLEGQEALWQRLRSQHHVRRIIVSGIAPIGRFPVLPQPLRWVIGARADDFAQALSDLTARFEDVVLVNMGTDLLMEEMASDGFHPGPAIYDKWAEALVSRGLAARFTA